jgi:hypothetical protein
MEFKAICPQCSKDIELSPDDLGGLDDHVDRERQDAAAEALDEAQEDDIREEMAALGSGRAWRDLAHAIRGGDRDEAEYQLDILAGEAGDKVQHEVSLGRFGSRHALRAA